MGEPRGSADVTQEQILAAARELFALRGTDRVTVRQVAAAAGVNHALVHRYFGTKREMVAEILRREALAFGAAEAAAPGDRDEALTRLREALWYFLTRGRVTSLLLVRAELDDLVPEHFLEGTPGRPIDLLSRMLLDHARAGSGSDPQALAVVVGAAVLGLASAQPLLMASAGLEEEDPADVLRRCVDVLVGLLSDAVDGDDSWR
ncbi:MAG: TetR/AcrR family transcriptional regulator [Acidimicrobiales bacterium]|jgi:AcrR family transcriptional regulator|nr:TetR/AcrR family transcriptional regulator [Acidimicrobiales bacterium]